MSESGHAIDIKGLKDGGYSLRIDGGPVRRFVSMAEIIEALRTLLPSRPTRQDLHQQPDSAGLPNADDGTSRLAKEQGS